MGTFSLLCCGTSAGGKVVRGHRAAEAGDKSRETLMFYVEMLGCDQALTACTPRKRQHEVFFISILIDLVPKAVSGILKQSESSSTRSSVTTQRQLVFW